MLDLLNDRRLAAGFEQLLDSHFRGQREAIVERVREWKAEEEQKRVVVAQQGFGYGGEYSGPTLVQSAVELEKKLQELR